MNENLKKKLGKAFRIAYKCMLAIFTIPLFIELLMIVNCSGDYFIQKKLMKNKLNSIPNVEVVNVWGHEDLDLEEMSARLIVNDTNEIVLHHLSHDVFDYPKVVYISEVNGCELVPFFKDSYGCYLDIGTESIIGKHLGLVFHTPEDVISNIDKISEFVSSLKQAPQLNYFCDTLTQSEMYIGVINEKGNDQDPINILFDFEKKIDFARTLDWKY